MKVLQQLGATEISQLWDWCKRQPLTEETKSSYVKGRLEKWYRYASNLQSVRLNRAKISSCPDPTGTEASIVTKIGDLHLPGWNSLLVCGGPTTISWHRDHGHFEGPSAMINLGEAIYHEAERNANLDQAIKFQNYELKDGMVVWIDTKRPHSATQKSSERFNLTFRTIKSEFFVKEVIK